MLAVSFLQWWYTRGWGIYFEGFRNRMSNLADFFSIGLLLKTLFSPFRQISSDEGSTTGGLSRAFSIFMDKLVSRVIGFIVRFLIIILGIVIMTTVLVLGLAFAIVWPCVPLLPLAGIIASALGVTF